MKKGIFEIWMAALVGFALMGNGHWVSASETAAASSASQDVEEIKSLEDRITALEENSWLGKVAIHGVLSGAYQHEDPSGPADAESIGRGAVIFQPEISIALTERDEIAFQFCFPAGNGLNGVSQMLISPWAANVEDDVKNINGRDRDYLLTAWFKHTFLLGDDHRLGVTGGIIDATAYLDQNAFANDEYVQFMNPALVNGPNGFAPSYDIGGAVEWQRGPLYVNGVVMNIGENDDGYNYNFYGAEVGYQLTTGIGQGNYRVIFEGGNNAFVDPDDTALEDRSIVFLSFDQQFGDFFGGWVRLGWGDDDAAVDVTNLYSGGIDIRGSLWGRGNDNIGIGYAYSDGGNTGIERIQVAEFYYRLVMNEWVALSADLQYQDNKFEVAAGNDIDAWTWGLRAVVEF